MIVERKDYKYKELCELMNDKSKTGKSKQLQLKNWRRYFEWENPTRQIYRITEIYDTPKEKEDGRINNGGAREGAGAKLKVKEEFDIIFPRFIFDEQRKSEYYHTGENVIYFNNNVISRYFGIYRNIYEAKSTDGFGNLMDKNVNLDIYDKISDKLREKNRSWILNKIGKIDGLTLTYGIIAFKGNSKKYFEYKDELLPDYDEAQQEFIKENNLKSVKDIVDSGKWFDMQDYINEKIVAKLLNKYSTDDKPAKIEYNNFKKFHKIIIEDPNIFKGTSLDFDNVKRMRRSLNDKVCEELYNFFLKKEKENYENKKDINGFLFNGESILPFDEKTAMNECKYIIDNYVRLKDEKEGKS